jgi:hypothetical protein
MTDEPQTEEEKRAAGEKEQLIEHFEKRWATMTPQEIAEEWANRISRDPRDYVREAFLARFPRKTGAPSLTRPASGKL